MSENIDFSIIIATRDRQAQLGSCLEAIADLHYPPSKFEVLVVDDGSRTPLDAVVAPYRQRAQIALHRQAGRGPAAARNYGASLARGRFLAFTDDDCRPAPTWLTQLEASLAGAPRLVVGGRVINALKDNVFAAASQELIRYLYEYFNSLPSRTWFLATNNMAMETEIFRGVRGFDPSYPTAAAEDRDLCDRLRLAGHRMAYAQDAVVYHSHRLNLAGFWAQHFGYGRGARRYWQARGRRSGEKLRVEPFSFYWGMLTSPLRREYLRSPRVVAALIALSQVANAAGYFRERFERHG